MGFKAANEGQAAFVDPVLVSVDAGGGGCHAAVPGRLLC
jgi:hypothetical protein